MESNMTIEDFKLWSVKALKVFLQLRKKSTDGKFDELVARAFITWEEHIAIDVAQEHLLRSNLEEYRRKLNMAGVVIPDPFSLNDGWLNEKAMNVWPRLYFTDMADYFKTKINTDLFTALINEYKQGKAYRYFTSGWVREVFYHPISRSSNVCLLSNTVKPSMRSTTPYQIWVAIEKDVDSKPGGRIFSAYCICTAGLYGGCNHIAGLLFRVEYAVRTGLTMPSCTSTPCQWNRPGGAFNPAKPEPLRDVSFTKDQYIKRETNYANSVRALAVDFTPLSTRQEIQIANDSTSSPLADLLRVPAKHSIYMQLKDRIPFPTPEQPKLPSAPMDVVHILLSDGGIPTVEMLSEKMKVTLPEIDNLAKFSKDQSDSELWMSHRKGRITASNFSRVNSCMKSIQSTQIQCNIHLA